MAAFVSTLEGNSKVRSEGGGHKVEIKTSEIPYRVHFEFLHVLKNW